MQTRKEQAVRAAMLERKEIEVAHVKALDPKVVETVTRGKTRLEAL